ncbi:hypothetical protein X887_4894 [Burkholderia pseudomallei MSHR4375]|nr:hypothetical protein X993_4565 [Burkholderia pseudomallei K42]KGV80179.1 hypothetical protein X887_4894 [Burkholderia pseudomallei MSHR4375]
MLERISDTIQLVGGRFAIPWRVTIEAAIAGDLQATPSHLFAQNLLGCTGEGDHRGEGVALEKQPKRRIELCECEIDATVGSSRHVSTSS